MGVVLNISNLALQDSFLDVAAQMDSFHLIEQLNTAGTGNQVEHSLGSDIIHIMGQIWTTNGFHVRSSSRGEGMTGKFHGISTNRQVRIIS